MHLKTHDYLVYPKMYLKILFNLQEPDDSSIIHILSEGQALLSEGHRPHQNIRPDHPGMDFNSYLTEEER